jgi:hypothetical protein
MPRPTARISHERGPAALLAGLAPLRSPSTRVTVRCRPCDPPSSLRSLLRDRHAKSARQAPALWSTLVENPGLPVDREALRCPSRSPAAMNRHRIDPLNISNSAVISRGYQPVVDKWLTAAFGGPWVTVPLGQGIYNAFLVIEPKAPLDIRAIGRTVILSIQ